MKLDPQAWGIRTKLLALLLPGIAAALAFDGWSDYQSRTTAMESAFDEVLVQPVVLLDAGLKLDAAGAATLEFPRAVQGTFESLNATHKHLFVGLQRRGEPADGAEQSVLGTTRLPLPVPGAHARTKPWGSAPGALVTFYDAEFQGYAVRVALLERTIHDAAGLPWHVRVQAAESTENFLAGRRSSILRELGLDTAELAMVALLIAVGVAWALRPLAELKASVLARQRGDTTPLQQRDVPHEVAPLVEAVNHYIGEHRHVMEEQQRFLADAAHQLRTPLAIMLAQAGFALREDDHAALRESLQGIVHQLQRSRRMADQLLVMAHASRWADASAHEECDLVAVAREVVVQYLPLARERHNDLGWQGGVAPLKVVAPAEELHEVLSNLVHNALRHTPAGGSVTVEVAAHEGFAVADVVDCGPGLAPSLRERVFERFHREEDKPRDGGAGLGLAIARAYARRYQGDVELLDAGAAPTTGLRARLRLPLAHSQ